jgi:hypothetical protein
MDDRRRKFTPGVTHLTRWHTFSAASTQSQRIPKAIIEGKRNAIGHLNANTRLRQIVTFDEGGVSGHRNHIAVGNAIR